MTQIVTRSQWGAKAPQGSRNVLGSVLGMAVHWEAAAPPAVHGACAGAVRQIQAFHMGPSRKWADIAYNYLFCNHGYLFEGRGKGIGSAANGTDFGNEHFYAVCWLGGPGHKPTPAALGAAADAHAMLAPGKPVYPHSHFFPTACPGPDLLAWVKAGAHHPTKPKPPVLKHGYVDYTDSAGVGQHRGPWFGREVDDFRERVWAAHADDKPGDPKTVFIVTFDPDGV